MIKYDYQNSIGFIINRIGKSLIYIIDQELRKRFNITFGQWKVLIILANSNSGLTQKEIADKLVLEGPTLIPIIDKLEKDDLVVRKNDAKDRRINRVFLTDRTNDLLNDTIQCVAQIKEICITDIAENEVLITKNTLEKMWRNLQSTYNLNCSEENRARKNTFGEPSPGIIVGKN